MQNDLFQSLENLFTKARKVDSGDPGKDIYMEIKFLSLYPGSFLVATEANRLSSKLPPWATQSYLFHSIEKQRPPRFTYPKGEQDKKWPKEALSKISQKYCCSHFHSSQILEIMSTREENVLESIGLNPSGGNKSGKAQNRRLPQQKSKAR